MKFNDLIRMLMEGSTSVITDPELLDLLSKRKALTDTTPERMGDVTDDCLFRFLNTLRENLSERDVLRVCSDMQKFYPKISKIGFSIGEQDQNCVAGLAVLTFLKELCAGWESHLRPVVDDIAKLNHAIEMRVRHLDSTPKAAPEDDE
jgi:hypothetical protein